jgi:DNA-binding protein YbaB
LSDDDTLPLSERSFTAATADGAVFVRVAVRGHVLGVQVEPEAMHRPGRELAERIMAAADVAYLQGQLAIRAELERGHVAADDIDDMPTEHDLAAAHERLGRF